MNTTITQEPNDFLEQTMSSEVELHISHALIAEIYTYRKAMHISQITLAEKSGVIQSIISRMENGVTIPKLQTLLRLTDALGLDVSIAVVPRHEMSESEQEHVIKMKQRKTKELEFKNKEAKS